MLEYEGVVSISAGDAHKERERGLRNSALRRIGRHQVTGVLIREILLLENIDKYLVTQFTGRGDLGPSKVLVPNPLSRLSLMKFRSCPSEPSNHNCIGLS